MNLIEHAQQAIDDVMADRVELPPELFEIGGFCGAQGRALVNRLCRAPLEAYLEVGVLHGATFCAALAGNDVRAVGIDNFSGFDGNEHQARANVAKWARHGHTRLIVQNAYAVKPESLGHPFGLFFYDGDHSAEATARALEHFLPALRDPCLWLVDDYNWPDVRKGVLDGLACTGLQVQWSQALGAGREGDAQGFWNGMWLACVTRG